MSKTWRQIPGCTGESRMTQAERDLFLANTPQNGYVLEIGTYHGVTAAWLADQRPESTIVSVDIFDEAEGKCLGKYDKWFANRRSNMHLWVGTSQDLISVFGTNRAFDVILVDADHRYEPTINELESALALCKTRGTILAHDYGTIDNVTLAVDCVLESGRLVKQIHVDRLIAMTQQHKDI